MQILNISNKHQVYAIFNGYGKHAYILYSTFYGIIGYANILADCGSHAITVDLYLDERLHYGCTDYATLIKRAITRYERQFVHKAIKYNVQYVQTIPQITLRFN